MRKRILSIVLVLALCLAYMPVQALAADLEIATVDISGNLPSFCSSPYEVTYGQTITFDLHAADPSEGYTILDYKTDRLSGASPEERAKEALGRHAFQLNSYAAACEEEGLKVAHKLLYLVRYGEFVEV